MCVKSYCTVHIIPRGNVKCRECGWETGMINDKKIITDFNECRWDGNLAYMTK